MIRSDIAPGRILVVLGKRGMGDAIEAFPVFDMIHERWPNAELVVACNGNTQAVTVAMHPHAKPGPRIHPGSVKHFWRGLRGFPSNYRALRGFDAVLFLYKKTVCATMVLTAKLAGAEVFYKHDYGHYRNPRINVHSDFPEYAFNQIIASRLLDLPMGSIRMPFLAPADEDNQFADTFFESRGLADRPVAIINTQGHSVLACWGIKNYAQVANRLVEAGIGVIINGGSNQQMREYNSVAEELADGVVLLERPSVGHLAAVIRKCDVLIGDPAGPLCVARAVRTPTISLIGPGEHGYPGQHRHGPVWWHHGPQHKVVTKIDTCAVENGTDCRCRFPRRVKSRTRKVMRALRLWKPFKEILKMTGLHKKSRRGPPPCFAAIKVEEVVAHAVRQIETGRPAVEA